METSQGESANPPKTKTVTLNLTQEGYTNLCNLLVKNWNETGTEGNAQDGVTIPIPTPVISKAFENNINCPPMNIPVPTPRYSLMRQHPSSSNLNIHQPTQLFQEQPKTNFVQNNLQNNAYDKSVNNGPFETNQQHYNNNGYVMQPMFNHSNINGSNMFNVPTTPPNMTHNMYPYVPLTRSRSFVQNTTMYNDNQLNQNMVYWQMVKQPSTSGTIYQNPPIIVHPGSVPLFIAEPPTHVYQQPQNLNQNVNVNLQSQNVNLNQSVNASQQNRNVNLNQQNRNVNLNQQSQNVNSNQHNQNVNLNQQNQNVNLNHQVFNNMQYKLPQRSKSFINRSSYNDEIVHKTKQSLTLSQMPRPISKDCVVCHKVFDTVSKTCLTKCGHKFHAGCMKNLPEKKCPVCDTRIQIRLDITNKCIVCLDAFTSQDFGTRTKLNCGHKLHRECFDVYVTTNNRCPICKKKIRVEKRDCPICLEPLMNAKNVTKTTCDHNFHAVCIKVWSQRGNNTCPVCRSSLVSN